MPAVRWGATVLERAGRSVQVGLLGLETNGLAERSIAMDLLRALSREVGFHIVFDRNLAFDDRTSTWACVRQASALDVLFVCLRATAAPLLADLRVALEGRATTEGPAPLLVFGGQTALASADEVTRLFPNALVWPGDVEAAFPRVLGELQRRCPSVVDTSAVAGLAALRRDRIAMPDQHSTERAVRAGGTVWVEASRGCRLSCSFCVLSNDSVATHWRPRPVGDLLDEIALIQDRFGVRDFSFSDYSAFESDDYVEEFLDAVRERRLTFTFRCDLRLGTARRLRHRLGQLRRAGMCAVYVGIESVLPEYQRLYRKGYPGRSIVDQLQQLGIVVVAGFIMLDPLHTAEQFRTQVDGVRRERILELIATPFKTMRVQRGTAYEKVALDRGIVDGLNPDLFSYSYHCADPRMEVVRRVVEFFHNATTDVYYNPYIENFARQQLADPNPRQQPVIDPTHANTLGVITDRYREAEMRLLEELSTLALTASTLDDLTRSASAAGHRFCRLRRMIFEQTARDYERLLSDNLVHYAHDLRRFLDIYMGLPTFHDDVLAGGAHYT